MVDLKITLPEGFLDEEVRCGYTVTHEMKEVWAVELDLLSEFMRVCKKHDIQFYTDGGTTIGCIRHHGFIPWDDDIDIAVSRRDYEKLCAVSYEFKHPYFFQTEQTDPGSYRGHIQLRNSETTGILRTEEKYRFKFNQGIFIDIFPKDNIPDDQKEKKQYMKKVLKVRDRAQKYIWMIRKNDARENIDLQENKLKTLLRSFCVCVIKILKSDKRQYSKYEKLMSKYKDIKTKQICNIPMTNTNNIARTINNADFLYENAIMMKFEFLELPTPSNYDDILTHSYGNYMEFVRGENSHGGVKFDTNKSYKKYLEEMIK